MRPIQKLNVIIIVLCRLAIGGGDFWLDNLYFLLVLGSRGEP